jgi:hypothetical protein
MKMICLPGFFLTISCTAELVVWGNNHTLLNSANKLTRFWAAFIQPSGSSEMLLLPQHPRLAGRSSAVLLSWCIMLATLTLLLWWLAYLVQWLELRAWLHAKLPGEQVRVVGGKLLLHKGGVCLEVTQAVYAPGRGRSP